jgi:SAM-dependent methyltransferase
MTATQWGADPEFFGPRHAAREQLMLDTLAPYLPPHARVLDAGAGAGHLANRLAELGHTVLGIDASEQFVAYATAHAAPGARFALGDVTALGVPDASVDVAIAGEVLEHIIDDDLAASELYRVLAPGGVCLVSMPADPALWDFSDQWAGHVRRYDAPSLRELFERQGFRVEKAFRWGFPFTRLYHRALYVPMLKRKAAGGDRPTKPHKGLKRLAATAQGHLLRLDRPYDGSPWGIGWVLVATKPAGHEGPPVG